MQANACIFFALLVVNYGTIDIFCILWYTKINRYPIDTLLFLKKEVCTMKRLFAYLLILVMLLALVGCNNTPTPKETTPEQTPTNGTSPTETTPEVTTPPEKQPDNQLKEIYNIVDRSGLQDTPPADFLECFYTDATFQYLFNTFKSSYVMVYYKDGTSENVKAALEAGHITIADLKKFDIWYYRRVRDDLPRLTISDLKGLIATYGENLTWEHFEQYYFVETGSG